MKKIFITAILTFLFVLGLSGAAWAEGEVSLVWDANVESDLAGYKLYWGTASGDYDNSIDVGNETGKTVIELTEGQTYYFAVTAYDTANNESGYSNELPYDVPRISPDVPKNLRKVTVEVSMTEEGFRVVVLGELEKDNYNYAIRE
jgi:fibronectin type 3 domain-containing protein